ncbi:MAG: TIGR00341 family protein [Deltaproteobacteria bacterium]|nr:TIGR00341 family protein [Deltaproteobacteria bacterium]
MALRLAEVFLPQKGDALFEELKNQFDIIDSYYACGDGGGELKLLLEAETAEPVFDFLQKRYGHMAGFRIIVVAVEAVIPRLKDDEETKESKTKIPTKIGSKRIYREELYEDIKSIASGSRTFYLMVALASCVAAIGLLRGNVAIIIGAMVLAPLLGPNMGMAFAATLGDPKLAKKSLQTNVGGSALALFIAVCIGWLASVDLNNPEIVSRLQVSYADIVLASASGAAGALSFTTGVSASLIGVMVAVALLPPLMVFGLLLGAAFILQASMPFSYWPPMSSA